jgi:hypothetical protein
MQYTFRETTRLRRTLGHQASAWTRRSNPTRQFVFVREVELVPVRDDEAANANTPKLDFESFTEVYSEVDVLWLSSTVFISRYDNYGWNELWESSYSVELCTKSGKVSVFVYTLSSEPRQHARSLPLSFLRNLMKDLPAGYLSHVDSVRLPSFSPPSFAMSLLSIFPSPVMSGASQRTRSNRRAVQFAPKTVTYELYGHLNRQQFDAVVSHHLISHVRLDIGGLWFSEMDERAREIRYANNTLQESSTLRHAVVPEQFLFVGLPTGTGDVAFTSNPHLESLEFYLSSCTPWTYMFLQGVTLNPNIQQLVLFVEVQLLDWNNFEHLLGRVLPGHPSLEAVKIVCFSETLYRMKRMKNLRTMAVH